MSFLVTSLQHLPSWLAEKAYYRFYVGRAAHFPQFFENARLKYCSSVRLRLCPTDVSHGEIALAGFYERLLTERIVKLARRGGLFVDVGANYGYYSCLWCGLNEENKAIAIEASPRNLTPLHRNVSFNGMQGNVSINAVACGEHAGHSKFLLGPDDQTGWGGLADKDGDDLADVNVVRLDEYLLTLGVTQVDVLKVDVEGADGLVLLGAERLIAERLVNHIFYEENYVRMKPLGLQPGQMSDFLNRFGYRSHVISGAGSGLVNWHAHLG